MTKGKKALIIICLVLVLLLGAAAFFVISYLKSPERKILAALEDNEYKEVVELFKEEMDGETTRLLLNELNERLDQVQTDFVDGTMDYDTADAFLTCLEEMNVSDSELQSKTEEIRRTVTDLNDSRQEYARAEELLQNGDYLDAIEAFKKVLESDPNYADAQAGITAATDKYRDNVLKEAEDFVAQKSYAKAIDVLEKALEVFPEDEQLLAQLEAYNKDSLKATKDEALDAAKKHADEEDYPSAIKTLRNALKTCPNDKDITSTLKTYSEAYVTLIVKEADKLIKEKNFASAIECIEDALEVLPDDDTLTEKLKEANESKPVSLSTLNAFNGGWQWNEGDPTDPFGVTHNDVCNFVIFTDETSDASNSMYTEYRLYGKYNTVSGKLVPHHSIKENGTAQVKLYADDELIYTSEVIGRKTDVILFEANIKGAEYIKIEVDYNIDANNSGAKGETLILMDVQLWGK